MADNDAASWVFDVPGLGISPAQALMFNRQQEEKEQARQDAIAQRNQYRQDQERERNEFRQSNILNRIDATKYHTGLQKFDDWAASKVDDIMAKYSDPKYASMPMNEFTATLNRDVLPLKSGYGAVKSKLEQEMANIKNVVAQNKYLDEAKLRDDVLNDIAGDYMTQDDKFGGHTFKPVDQMDLNKSHTLDRLTGPNAYNYVNNAGIAEFEKGILDTIPKNGGSLYSLKRPDGGVTNYQGRMSPYQVMSEQPNQYGFMGSAPRYSIAKEQGRVDANGNPVEALPEDLMKRMIDTPAKAMVFRKMMDMNPQMGLNPNNQLDQQRFAYGMLNTLLGSNQPGIHSQVQPPGRNHTTINMNAQRDPSNWINGLVDAARNGDTEAIKRVGGFLYQGNGPEKFDEIHFIPKSQSGTDSDQLQFNFSKKEIDNRETIPGKDAKTGQDTEVANPNYGKNVSIPQYERISVNDPDLKSKLVGVYQRLMGGDTKLEKVPFYKQNKANAAPQQAPQQTKRPTLLHPYK